MKSEEKTKELQHLWSWISLGINSALIYILSQENIIWYLPIAIILVLTAWGYFWATGEIRKKNFSASFTFFGLLAATIIGIATTFDKGHIVMLDILIVLIGMLSETAVFFLLPYRFDILRRIRNTGGRK